MIRDTVPRDRDSHPRSPCYDDLRFISKDPELAAEAVAICDGCAFRACVPVLAEILRPPGRHQLEGVWDGRHYRENANPQQTTPAPDVIRATHCHRDHEMTDENTYMDSRGKRNCRACGRDAKRRYKDRQKGAADAA